MAAIAERVKNAREAGRRNKAIADADPPAHWNSVLNAHGLRTVSSREIRVRRLPSRTLKYGNPVVCYTQDPDTLRVYQHGAEVGHGLIAKHEPKCIHSPLLDSEWEPLTFKTCPDCGQFLSGDEVVYRPIAAQIFNDPDKEWGIKKGIRSPLWKDARKAKIHHEHDDDGITRYTARGFEALRFPSQERDSIEVEAAAPEIDQRRREAALRYELQNPPYRAPHKKVIELRDAGFDINRIARKLKVSPSTIDNRLREVPETAPQVDLLALRVTAGGGYSRSQGFWRTEARDGNERGASLGNRRIPRITAGNYKHRLEDGEGTLSVGTSVIVTAPKPVYGYQPKTLCKDTECPFVHDSSETCLEVSLRLEDVKL